MKPQYPEPHCLTEALQRRVDHQVPIRQARKLRLTRSLWQRWKRNLRLWSCINSHLDLPAWSSLQVSSLGPDGWRRTLFAPAATAGPQNCCLLLLVPAQTSPTAGLDHSQAQQPAAPVDVSRRRRQEVTLILGFQWEPWLAPNLGVLRGCLHCQMKVGRQQPVLTSRGSRMDMSILYRMWPPGSCGPRCLQSV